MPFRRSAWQTRSTGQGELALGLLVRADRPETETGDPPPGRGRPHDGRGRDAGRRHQLPVGRGLHRRLAARGAPSGSAPAGTRAPAQFVAPSEPTIRRTVTSVDAAEADVLVGRWLAEQVRAGRLAARQVPTCTALALDGKTLKGSWAVDRPGPR